MKGFLMLCSLLGGWMVQLYPAEYSASDSTRQSADSSKVYFEEQTHLLSLKLFTLTKYNTLGIKSDSDGQIILRPNGNTKIGVGFNYKFAGLAVSFGRPLSQSSVETYGNTSSFDIRGSLFGRKIGLDGFIQGYKGYYLANPGDHMEWDKPYYPLVGDLRIFSLGGSAFYMFNSDKFSYKAAYLRNVVQKESAGSVSAGLFFYQDILQTDDGFIPEEVVDSIWVDFDLKKFSAFSIGLSAGYQYTFVIRKNLFINLQLTPGIGYRRSTGETLDDQMNATNDLAWQVLARASVGYEFKHFYVGVFGSSIWRSFSYRNYDMDLGTEQFRFMIGKRFNVSRKQAR